MRLTTILAGAALLAPSVALADHSMDLHAPGTAQLHELVAQPPVNGVSFARMMLPPNGNIHALAQSRIIYLNRHGVTLHPGNDDSRTQTSSIPNQTSSVPAWGTSQ